MNMFQLDEFLDQENKTPNTQQQPQKLTIEAKKQKFQLEGCVKPQEQMPQQYDDEAKFSAKVSSSFYIRHSKTKFVGNIFNFIKRIGNGSQGVVYLAHRINYPDIKYAIKKIPIECMRGLQLERLIQLNIMVDCASKPEINLNIVKLHQTYINEGYLYLIMDYINGKTLDKVFCDQLFPNMDQLQTFAKKMFEAIRFIHSHGIIHRDIKLENIILQSIGQNNVDWSDPQPVLIDFGLSNIIKSPSELCRKQVGTIMYMAPQVLSGNSYDNKCDIWSLGIVFYTIIMGKFPFNCSTQLQYAKAVMTEGSRPYSQLDLQVWLALVPELTDLLNKMLVFCPNKRISAEEALKHKFFKLMFRQQEKKIPNTNKSILKTQIQKYQYYNKLRRVALKFLVSIMTPTDKVQIKQFFETLTRKKKSRFIELKDFQKKLKSWFPDLSQKIQIRIFSKIDINKDGKIDLDEFISVFCEKDLVSQQQKLNAAFDFFDLDQDGSISKEEISTIICRAGILELEEIMKSCDKNNDGKIDRAEFIRMMKTKRF